MSFRKLNSAICIIGAGPAGASTSIFLSKKGIEHIIVDAAIFPRDKTCGDGLDLKTLRMLNHIDCNIIPNELLNNEHFTVSSGVRFISKKGVNSDFVYKQPKGQEDRFPFLVAKRFHFDNFLIGKIDRKSAHFRQGTKVKTITKEGANWKLLAEDSEGEVEITCQMLIGADGDHSTVLRYLGDRKINRRHYFSTVRQYWKNIEGIHEKNLLEVYSPANIPWSYFWIFPLANGEANVGYGMTSEFASKKNINIRESFKQLLATDPSLAHRFKNAEPCQEIFGCGIPSASLKRKVVGDGWLLVGDAASIASPTTAEGIGTGMMTGYIAARFIEKALKEKSFSEATLANYSREIFRRMEGEISKYNLFLKFPSAYSYISNHLIGDNIFCHYFVNKQFSQWIETCYEKEVIVNLD